jgi:hypothetical protein
MLIHDEGAAIITGCRHRISKHELATESRLNRQLASARTFVDTVDVGGGSPEQIQGYGRAEPPQSISPAFLASRSAKVRALLPACAAVRRPGIDARPSL